MSVDLMRIDLKHRRLLNPTKVSSQWVLTGGVCIEGVCVCVLV